ncbi:HAD family hydrolase [Kitasatospora sp. NPDC056651]|uniref:HAD family hydrolase n=1 Tax=Kitasatospora sp. NPDC056651 TaxID=3345892 RepID=UPI0036A55758
MGVLVASDLDRTLIYSERAMALDTSDRPAPRLLCVEEYQGRPLSFMTGRAAALLAELARETCFVPATTRTPEQYGRIRLPGPTPDWVPAYAICANGGQLLVDGVPDGDWRTEITGRIAAGSAPLEEVVRRLAECAAPEWTRKRSVADGLFAYLVVERAALPEGWLAELTGWCAERGWTVSLQGRKVYAVPVPLTKSAALAEVVRRGGGADGGSGGAAGRGAGGRGMGGGGADGGGADGGGADGGAVTVLAAGDSLLDADLLLAADAGWRPGHGELADSGWTAPGVTALAEVGVTAGEEIVRRFLAAVSGAAGAPGPAGPAGPAGAAGATGTAGASAGSALSG